MSVSSSSPSAGVKSSPLNGPDGPVLEGFLGALPGNYKGATVSPIHKIFEAIAAEFLPVTEQSSPGKFQGDLREGQIELLSPAQKEVLLSGLQEATSKLQLNCLSDQIRAKLECFRKKIQSYNSSDSVSKNESDNLVKEFKAIKRETEGQEASRSTSSRPPLG